MTGNGFATMPITLALDFPSRIPPFSPSHFPFFIGEIPKFPIARTLWDCILRRVVQRFSQCENLFTFPGDQNGREEECQEGREEVVREEVLREEVVREEGREEVFGQEVEWPEEDREEVGCQAHAERRVHE